jgi:hypothetical protein
MATPSQMDLFRRYERMFGRTREWRIVARNEDITRMNPRDSYAFLGHLIDAVKYLKFTRLPRSAGLPQTPKERAALYERAFVEEGVARLACPDDERETWCSDTRPSPFDERSYFEQTPQILEDLEVDGYLRLPLTYNDHDQPHLLVS